MQNQMYTITFKATTTEEHMMGDLLKLYLKNSGLLC
jgi:hypothetical protein